MSRIVIAARTRMGGNRRCIGGHDLDRAFRRVRLLDWLGDNWPADAPFQVGELWKVDYQDKISARPPHAEDVIVREYGRLSQVPDLKGLVLQHVRPWCGGPEVLFDRTVRRTRPARPSSRSRDRCPAAAQGTGSRIVIWNGTAWARRRALCCAGRAIGASPG